MSEPSDPNPVPSDRGDQRDAEVLAAYRAASQAADRAADRETTRAAGGPAYAVATGADAAEAPRPETRAAILAAAARAVQARPVAVGAAAAPFGLPARFRYRAPLALAASLLVGTVAWQLAAQFDPAPASAPIVVTAPDGAAMTPAAPTAAAEAASTAPSQVTAPSVPTEKTAAEPSRPAASAATRAEDAANRERNASSAAAQTVPMPPAPLAEAGAAPPPAAREAPPGAAAARVAPASAETPAAGAAASAPIRPATAPPTVDAAASPTHSARLAAPRPAAPAETQADAAVPPVRAEEQVRTQPVERRLFSEEPPPRPLPLWLERIAELRRAGRDAEAEVELQALRRAYPQAQIPPALLAPSPR